MASETDRQNGVLNGETASKNPSAAIDPEPCSSTLDPVEPTDADFRGPVPGTQEQDSIHKLMAPEESDIDSNNPEASALDDGALSSGSQPTTLQGTRQSPSLSHIAQDQEVQEEHEPQPQPQHPEHQPGEENPNKNDVENLLSDADEGSTHVGQDNDNKPTPENDVAELSEGTEAQELEKDKINHPTSDKPKDGAGERPVRQKLKETSIAGVPRPNSPEDNAMVPQVASAAGADSGSDANSVDGRGRLRRKRSLGDMNDDDEHEDTSGGTHTDETGHRRKRSRDSKTDDDSNDKQTGSMSKSIAEDTREIADNMEAKTVANEGGIRTPTEELKNAERDAANHILSPKKKRSRDQFDKDHLKSDSMDEKAEEGAASVKIGEPLDSSKAASANRTVEGEPEKKRHRDDSQDRSSQVDSDLLSKKISPSNPFSNSAGVSPFASMASKPSELTSKDQTEKKEQPMTSASAFASSRLASFASSGKSPFGALGGASTSAFKSAHPAKTTGGKEQPPPPSSSSLAAFAASPFAAAATASPFGAIGGGEASFRGSGFSNGFAAAASKLGGGLKGFAAPPGGSAILRNSSKPKIFGAGGSENEDQEAGKGGDDGESAFEGLEQEKGDERFHEQQTETGEEGESTVFSCRGKLYHFDGKEWKERGVGVFKVNVREPADNEEEEPDEEQPRDDETEQEEDKGETDESDKELKRKTARVIMRADGVWRVILNIPIFKGMKAGDPSGAAPKGKQVHFAGFEEGKSVPFLFRTGNDDVAKELYAALQTVQESL
ncbi:hypothetical protein AJ78_05355 [Emergomyces pasteurianus Ep9510]|uniref:RanBD1 domain-containing protein n=1 Tax=Emergomyces pasteurianus Ep9510 TaxID=1447872 RepID=A0A1J9PE40_9EURO|nr:hypothetical protein AJ78_05355 [Emergomyces pasteurianus Ep9510]